MANEKVENTGESQGSDSPKLTKRQKEVLHYLTDEFLTVKQISIRLQIGVQRVYKIKQSLEKRGLISRHFSTSENLGDAFTHGKNGIRIHGQFFKVNILYKDQRYKDKINKILSVDGNSVQCFPNVVMIYSNQSFFGDSVDRAMAESVSYFQRLFVTLENDLKIMLVKPRSQNIEMVKIHISEIHNELAKECNVKAEKIRIYARDDGKMWFEIDNSFNLHEAEFLHPQTAMPDADKVIPFFNDLRDKPAPKVSEIAIVLHEVQKQMYELAAGQLNTNTQLQTLISILYPDVNKKKDDPKIEEKFERVSYIG